MHSLPLFGIAALLGATLSALGAADHSASEVADFSAQEVADFSASGVVDFSALEGGDGAASGTASGTADADLPTCFGQPATLVGSGGDDVIVGTAENDVIVARAGNDVVRGRGGADLVCGGRGDDRLLGGSSPLVCDDSCPRGDRISGDEGDDRIVDRVGFHDLLLGGSGDDYLMSSPPRGGGPCCVGRGGARTLKGGPGADQLSSERSHDDDLRGGPGPDSLSSMSGRGNSRHLAGGPGPDVLTVAGDGDIVIGLTADGDQVRSRGEIFLVLVYDSSPGPIEADLAAGTVRLMGAAAGDVITHLTPVLPVMVVNGTERDDRMTGGTGDDWIFALGGNDILAGDAGGDILAGDQGNDVIDGDDGDDSLYGDKGDDQIDGGPGEDSADGGRGRDTCIYAESVSGCSPSALVATQHAAAPNPDHAAADGLGPTMLRSARPRKRAPALHRGLTEWGRDVGGRV